jgi:hypothetical protein
MKSWLQLIININMLLIGMLMVRATSCFWTEAGARALLRCCFHHGSLLLHASLSYSIIVA